MTTRSELETIGQRMTTRLGPCQMLSSIEVEFQAESLVLTLQTISPVALNPRILRFCLNFLGGHKQCAEQTELFIWCAAFVEQCDPHACRIWIDCHFFCGYQGFDVLAELILLSLKLSREMPLSPSPSNLSDLFQVYRTPEEVLAFYEGFVAHVIAEEADLQANACDPQLYARFLCCPTHRRLLLQRLVLNHWLHHLFDNWEPDQEYHELPEMEYVSAHPTLSQMQQRLATLLEQTFSAQAWLEARFAYSVQTENEHWDRPTLSCQSKHHVSFACCAFHTAMSAIGDLFSAWLEHFDDLYQIREMKSEDSGKFGLCSVTGIALLIRLAHLDISHITFTRWFEDLPSKDVSTYHQQGNAPRGEKNERSMNQQQARDLLRVTQQNDYTWMAVLPEVHLMWAEGHSEDEAIANWQREYDQPAFASLFTSIQAERAKHPSEARVVSSEERTPFQRPLTVDFPYRGKLYRMETNAGLPKHHVVLSNGTILVVCGWNGRVPALLSDIRRSPEGWAPHRIAQELDALEAFEIPLPAGQTTKAMAVLDWQGQRYAVDDDSNALVEMPDGRLYRVHTFHGGGEPKRIAEIIPFDPTDSYMPYQLEHFGTTPAIPMPLDYPGIAHAPRDLRIRFSYRGDKYIVSGEAYEQKMGILFIPDHGYIRIRSYLESMPVQLSGLQPLAGSPPASEKVAVALRLADAVDVEPWVPDEQKG